MATLQPSEHYSALRALAHARAAILRAERAFTRNRQSRSYLLERLNEITKWVGIVRAMLKTLH